MTSHSSPQSSCLSFFASSARCHFPATVKDFVPSLEGTDVFSNNAKPIPKSDIVALLGVEGKDGFDATAHCFFRSQTFLLHSFSILSIHLFPHQPPLFGNNCIASKYCFLFPPPLRSAVTPSPYLLLWWAFAMITRCYYSPHTVWRNGTPKDKVATTAMTTCCYSIPHPSAPVTPTTGKTDKRKWHQHNIIDGWHWELLSMGVVQTVIPFHDRDINFG